MTSGAVFVTSGARVAARLRTHHHVGVKSWPRGAKIVATFLLVAVFFATQNALVRISRGSPIDWQWDVMHEFVYWLVWAGFTPAVLAAARRWPLAPDAGWKAVGRGAVRHAGVMLVVAPLQITTAYLVHFALRRLTGSLSGPEAGAWLAARGAGVVWGTFAGFLYYWVIAAVYWAAEFQRLYRQERLQAAQLEASFTTARLDALRTQLQPHFLFNTLNAIYVLAGDDPPRARQMLLRLSDLLRRSIADGERHEVPLAAELELLDAYLGIQRVRFDERLRVRLEIDADARVALVPTLLLQPLVENAIRHGLEDGTTGGGAGEIVIGARRQGDQLAITVRDDGRGLVAGAAVAGGVGLANTRERLARLYGDRQRLELRPSTGGGAVVEVTMPFHTEP